MTRNASSSAVADADSHAPEETLATLPQPEQITLLFKHAKQTVLLSVFPSQPFVDIKALLLMALRSRNISSLSGTAIPESPEDLDLGVLAERKDATKGWVPLCIKEQEVAESKGAKRKGGGKQNVLNGSPAGAGLVDGSYVAFRIKKANRNETTSDTDRDEDEMDLEDDPGWDVVLPKYDIEEE